jgi:hypothetical protein
MLLKLIISIAIAVLITVFVQYLLFRNRNRQILKINKSILQSAILYFIHKEMKSSETNMFSRFVKSRLTDINLMRYVSGIEVDIIDNKVNIAYQFKLSEKKYKKICYEIRKSAAET